MFYLKANDYIYTSPVKKPGNHDIYLPIEVDTEFEHPTYDLNNPTSDVCKNICAQSRSIDAEKGIIHAHPQNNLKLRHECFKTGFTVVDYLANNGYDVSLSRISSDDKGAYPFVQIDLYAYFAVAELLRIFLPPFSDDILTLITNPDNQGIEQGRRLRTYSRVGNKMFNWVVMPWLLTINGQQYRVKLSIYDTCAVHGKTDYKTFCYNSGVNLEYKDNFTTLQKKRMGEMYIDKPDDFDNYALGDLYNHRALLGNARNFEKIYESLGLNKYYTIPRLTIGSTVSKIVESAIKKLFNSPIDDREVINKYCKYGCADWLKRQTTRTACLNAKVDGGRCRNNRPIDTTVMGALVDIDISSCYGEGLRQQLYPLGIPMVIDYPAQSQNNAYLTLRQFIKKYKNQLIPGLWQLRASLKPGYILEHPQDYFASWFPPKDISRMPTDTELENTEQWWTVDNVGEIKILQNEICHTVITHDGLQWIENIASKYQKKELLDNLIVETAMYYPASARVNTIDELVAAHNKHTGKNTTEGKHKQDKHRKVAIEEECHAWFGVTLGELLIDKLLIERKKHPKKTSFNELYKLCVNTVYGDMVSPFFTVGNVVVGNNITARARALAWYMEKGFNGWQTITDGCVFDLNEVVYPRDKRRVTGESVVNFYRDKNKIQHTLKPLKMSDELSVTDNSYEFYVGDETGSKFIVSSGKGVSIHKPVSEILPLINTQAMVHLQELFADVDVLHKPSRDVYGNARIGQFEFEVKDVYDQATFHGSANYCLTWGDDNKFGMRSYSRRGVKRVTEVDDLLTVDDADNPAYDFLLSLRQPESVERGRVHIKERILKIGDYRRNYQTWKDTVVYPGCTIEMPGVLHEYSLSQFTFQTYSQLKSWRMEYERLLRKYGQSYEMFFLNSDGTLNFQEMVVTIDERIRNGAKNFFDGIDKRSKHMYRDYLSHQDMELLAKTRDQLDKRYRLGAEFYKSMTYDGLDHAAMDLIDMD